MGATMNMAVGPFSVAAVLCLLGLSNQFGLVVPAMVVFSVGEMLSSPKFSEFLGNIAPPDKKAMWIGFSQAPILIGWTLEGKIGPQLYHLFSSKDIFARQMLVQCGLRPDQVATEACPVGEAFKQLVE